MKTLTILLIDDHPAILKSVGDLLTYIGYNVVLAASGEEGVAQFERQPYDVVVTDFSMPGMNGLEVAERIKELSPTTPIVLLSIDTFKQLPPHVDLCVRKGYVGGTQKLEAYLRELSMKA